jgi:endonuclease/exonuclease/phosphatase family metal-dependent hydrolase
MTHRFTVASYNIHGCVGKDRNRDAKRIAQVICDLEADIVGLQEVDSRAGEPESVQMDYLAALTGMKAITGPAIERHDRHYGNLLLTNHPINDVRRLDLSVRGQEPRGALDVDVEVRGVLVRVIVTHFGLGVAERRFQAKRLLAAIDGDGDGNRVTVVMGDFNEWFPLSRSLGWLQRRLGTAPAPRTYPAFFPILSLDRIWVSPPHALRDIEAYNSGQARVCSDHLPLRATIVAEAQAMAAEATMRTRASGS